MTIAAWEEQGYHFAGIIITFVCAWAGVLVAVTVDKCNSKATSLLNIFAGGGLLDIIYVFTFVYYVLYYVYFRVNRPRATPDRNYHKNVI